MHIYVYWYELSAVIYSSHTNWYFYIGIFSSWNEFYIKKRSRDVYVVWAHEKYKCMRNILS